MLAWQAPVSTSPQASSFVAGGVVLDHHVVNAPVPFKIILIVNLNYLKLKFLQIFWHFQYITEVVPGWLKICTNNNHSPPTHTPSTSPSTPSTLLSTFSLSMSFYSFSSYSFHCTMPSSLLIFSPSPSPLLFSHIFLSAHLFLPVPLFFFSLITPLFLPTPPPYRLFLYPPPGFIYFIIIIYLTYSFLLFLYFPFFIALKQLW